MQNNKTPCFVFDLDGTLADHHGVRNAYDETKVKLDKPIEPVWAVLKALAKQHQIIFVSGRTNACFQDTWDWIMSRIHDDGSLRLTAKLYMRNVGDNRKDSIVKKEIYDNEIIPNYNIIGVFDDRLQVCRMLYENNIFCFNVNQGLKEF